MLVDDDDDDDVPTYKLWARARVFPLLIGDARRVREFGLGRPAEQATERVSEKREREYADRVCAVCVCRPALKDSPTSLSLSLSLSSAPRAKGAWKDARGVVSEKSRARERARVRETPATWRRAARAPTTTKTTNYYYYYILLLASFFGAIGVRVCLAVQWGAREAASGCASCRIAWGKKEKVVSRSVKRKRRRFTETVLGERLRVWQESSRVQMQATRYWADRQHGLRRGLKYELLLAGMWFPSISVSIALANFNRFWLLIQKRKLTFLLS